MTRKRWLCHITAMQRHALLPHPAHPPRGVAGVAVDLAREGHALSLRYRVDGADMVAWPARALPVRTDGLWRTTCFELFALLDDDERYVEVNLSPSAAWAAYSFDGYREGMADLPIAPPAIERLADGIAATIDLSALPHGELRVALTAVIEEADGTKSFWSLAHPDGAPDFHHAACFAARLPAPSAP